MTDIHTHEAHTGARRADSVGAWLRLAGFAVAAGAACLHAMTTLTPFPGWDLDPLIFPVPWSGIGPDGSKLIDFAAIVGAALMLLGERLSGRRIMLGACALYFVGAVAMSLGARVDEPDGHTGSSWIAAMAVGLGVMHVCRASAYRRMALALLLAMIVALAARGGQQTLIDHANTVREFQANRTKLFDAQGWTYESPMAKAYERRIMQREATGWFGLSNVYATFAAGGAAAGIVLAAGTLVGMRRGKREGDEAGEEGHSSKPSAAAVAGVWILCGAGISALAFADAKGGFAACVLGVGFALGVRVAAGLDKRPVRWNRWRMIAGPALALGAVAATFALVIARGAVGERVGEASVLFRWHYMQAAARIGLETLTGCGPGAFQAQYTIHKNPLNPEDVTSAHNVLMDWWACAGVLGLAWIALWLRQIANVGWSAYGAAMTRRTEGLLDAQSEKGHGADSAGAQVRALMLVGVAVTLIAMRLEQRLLTVDLALVRVGSLMAWCVVVWLLLAGWGREQGQRIGARGVQFALAAAGVAMGTHALIDQAGTWPASAQLLMFMLAAAGAPLAYAGSTGTVVSDALRNETTGAARGVGRGVGRGAMLNRVAGAAACAGLLALAAVNSLPTGREARLLAAARDVAPLAEFRAEHRELSQNKLLSPRQVRERAEALTAALSEVVGKKVEMTPRAVEEAMAEAERRRMPSAIEKLLKGDRGVSSLADYKSRREAGRLHVTLAQAARANGRDDEAKRHFDAAIEIAKARVDSASGALRLHASEFSWLALLYETRQGVLGSESGGEEARRDMEAAAEVLERGVKLDPYGIEQPKRLMRLYSKLERRDEARTWAAKTLELDKLKRFDRAVQGLTDAERAEAEGIVGGR